MCTKEAASLVSLVRLCAPFKVARDAASVSTVTSKNRSERMTVHASAGVMVSFSTKTGALTTISLRSLAREILQFFIVIASKSFTAGFIKRKPTDTQTTRLYSFLIRMGSSTPSLG